MLANLAINEESCPYKAYTNIDTFFNAHKKGLSYDKLLKPKNYLNIPYDKKDEAKELGALWEKNIKKWYYKNDLDSNNIKKLLELQT